MYARGVTTGLTAICMVVVVNLCACQARPAQQAEAQHRESQPAADAALSTPQWTGKKLTLPKRMRGVNVPSYSVDPALVERLARHGCNAMRINFGVDRKGERDGKSVSPPTPDNPLAPYRENLARLDAILPVCQKLNVRVILCASDIYQRKVDYFWSQADKGRVNRQYLIDFWKAFAKRYKDAPAIVAYDVLNEPHYKKGDGAMWYGQLLPATIKAIRAVNPDIWLVVEPGPWGLPGGFEEMPAVDDPHVIYSFHMYAPHTYTHQGVGKNRKTRGKLTYPGPLKQFPTSPEQMWNKQALEQFIQPAVEFARKHHARIFVGEFGVIRWAPGRAQWLADCISLFEKYGFDWMYHSPSGWNGWNQTFSPEADDASLVGKDSDGGYRGKAMRVLLKGWANNERGL